MKTVSPPPPIRRREVRVQPSNIEARFAALESTVALLKFWVSLALTLTVFFATLIFVWRVWLHTKGAA